MNNLYFAHIVNPVHPSKSSHLRIAQPITLESMLRAKTYAQRQANVELYMTKFVDDTISIPDGFTYTPDLNRSILDVTKFNKKRQLPLFIDILDRLYKATQAEYLIYSNIDIAVMPYFYTTVLQIVNLGYQAFSINRRTIKAKYRTIDELPLMYAELGEPHRGWDCFVFHRSLYPNFIFGDICLGVPLVGLAMISNLIAFSKNFIQITGAHLTFHIGNDRSWHERTNIEYEQHNRNEVIKLLLKLDDKIGGFDGNSPPGEYIRFHKNKLIAYIYDNLMMRLYVPAKYTRSNQEFEI